jgi:hypothetical protein
VFVAGVWSAYALQTWAALLAGAVIALPVFVYASYLWLNTDHVQRELWGREEDTGLDLDGDGVVGEPRRETRYIDVRGELVPFAEEVTYDRAAETVTYVSGFDAPADVVADFFRLAKERGLGRARLVTEPRLTVGNGMQVSKGLWERWTSAAAARGWIADGGNGVGYRWMKTPDSIIAALEAAGRAGGRAGRPVPVGSSQSPVTGGEVGKGV